jgi:hypothetical protein
MNRDAHLWHPWLPIERPWWRSILHGSWDDDAWAQIKPNIKNALAERSKIRRAGWFNLPNGYHSCRSTSVSTRSVFPGRNGSS